VNGDSILTISDTAAVCRRSFGYVGLFSLFINLLMLTVSLYTLQIYDHVLASRSLETLVFLTIITVGAVLVLGLLELVRSRLLVRISLWVEQTLALQTFERSIAAALHAKPYCTEALRDLGQVRSFVAGAPIFALFDAPWVPVYLAVIFLLHPLVGLVALSGLVVLFLSAVLTELLSRRPLRDANQAVSRAMQRAEAAARNAEAIDAMCMMPGAVARWSAENDRALQQQGIASDRAGAVLAFSKFLRLALQIAVMGAGRFTRDAAGAERRRDDRRVHPDLAGAGAGRAGHRHLENSWSAHAPPTRVSRRCFAKPRHVRIACSYRRPRGT
jgi:ABC-type protease/lipase transport system fused ATPase/permease subunit